MSEPRETRPSDATEPTIQPGDDSGPRYSGESLFAEDAGIEASSDQPTPLTTSTATASTTPTPTLPPTAEPVTPRKGTKKARLALRAELMQQHGIKEYMDRATGRMVLYLNDNCTPELIAEIRRLEK